MVPVFLGPGGGPSGVLQEVLAASIALSLNSLREGRIHSQQLCQPSIEILGKGAIAIAQVAGCVGARVRRPLGHGGWLQGTIDRRPNGAAFLR